MWRSDLMLGGSKMVLLVARLTTKQLLAKKTTRS
jgi:hypothetical protein